MKRALLRIALATVGGSLPLGLIACRPNDMREQARYEYLESNDFFADGMTARQPVSGSVPREGPLPRATIRTGLDAEGFLVAASPVEITLDLLERGRARFDTFCSVCHGKDGYGSGIVTRRGFPKPPSLHENRLRAAPLGHFTHVIENGYGIMYAYADRVQPEDRWAIAAYIRALQFSQRADAQALAPEDRQRLEEARP